MGTSRRKRRANVKSLLVLAVGVIAMLASLDYLLHRGQRLAWREALEQAAPDEARYLLRPFISRDDAGIELAVSILESPRDEIVAAAQAVLFEETARWQLLDEDMAKRKQQFLADVLADQIAKFSPAGRRAASELAVGLLRNSITPQRAGSSKLTLACQRILHGSLADVADGSSVVQRTEPFTLKAESEHHTVAWQEAVDEPPVNQRRPSTGPIKPSLRILDKATPPSPTPSRVDLKPGEHVMKLSPGSQPAAAPGLLPADMTHARPLKLQQPAIVTASPPQPDIEAPQQSPRPLPDLTQAATPIPLPSGQSEARLETMQLVERLQIADPAAAERAREELLRRGFTELEFELSKRLTDPNRQVRLRWLQALPGMSQIDARPWLLWLSRDGDAEIRRAALTLMATSNEPEMMRRIVQMAREEIDPQVRSQAEKVIKHVR